VENTLPPNTQTQGTSNYRSQEINSLIGSLAKAQGLYKKLIPNEDAPGGKFANLQAILDSVREALASNGLGFYQYIELLDEGSGGALLRTVLAHESGQYISSCARVITGKTDRQTGNVYEIHKRFHALMILGIAPSKNDPMAFDDNGEELAEMALIEKIRKPKNPKDDILDRSEVISTDQYNELMIELDGYEDIAKDIMEAHSISTLADLPREEYHRARSRILKIKRVHDEYTQQRSKR
jgi:hypothetical protein